MQRISYKNLFSIRSSIIFNCRRLVSTVTDPGFQIKAYNDKKQHHQAIALFESLNHGEKFTPIVINQILRSYIEVSNLKKAKDLHQQLSSYLLNNLFIRTSLIRLYMKDGDVKKSKEIFLQSSKKTAPMYIELLLGLCRNKHYEEALEILSNMPIESNEYLYSTIFKVCSQIADRRSLTIGKERLTKMPKEFRKNPIILTSALHMLVECGDMDGAREHFSQMEKNIVAYGVMINGFLSNKMPSKAIEFFFEIPEVNEIILTVFFGACAQLGHADALEKGRRVFSQLPIKYRQMSRIQQSVLNMFTKCHDEQSAQSYFNEIKPNSMCYASMMKMFNEINQSETTLRLYEEMKTKKVPIDSVIFTLIIDACSQIGHLKLCRSIVSEIPQEFLEDLWIQNGLIDMWGKSGDIDKAKEIFNRMKMKNNITYTSMIHSFGLNGLGIEAVRLFDQIPRNERDSWMFVCVLNACSHSGLIQQAEEIFNDLSIEERTEQIYTSMIDVYSRGFRFDRAEMLIKDYEKRHRPSLPMNMAILSGARNQKNADLAENIFRRIESLFPRSELSRTSARILLANTLSSMKDLTKATDLRNKMMQTGGKKVIGYSWTIIDEKIEKFHAHDRTHPRFNDIQIELNRLIKELKEEFGYKPDSSWITRNLMEDETQESVLNGHSERLAIALNLIQRPMPKSFQIVKNLRVCGDCHEFTKLVAKLRQCSIVVRDANRIHHFTPDGKCSCNDYF